MAGVNCQFSILLPRKTRATWRLMCLLSKLLKFPIQEGVEEGAEADISLKENMTTGTDRQGGPVGGKRVATKNKGETKDKGPSEDFLGHCRLQRLNYFQKNSCMYELRPMEMGKYTKDYAKNAEKKPRCDCKLNYTLLSLYY